MVTLLLENWRIGIAIPLLTYALLIMIGRGLSKRRARPIGPAYHLFALLVAFMIGAPVYLVRVDGYTATVWWKAIEAAAILTGGLVFVQLFSYVVYEVYLPSRRRVKVPRLLHDITTVIVLIIAISIILKVEFNLSLPTILTTSTILAAIIGLALQELLSNLIAGMTMQVEKPFQVGDWVALEGVEGEVVGMSWRATRLLTIEGTTVIVPNGVIAKGRVVNYYSPTRPHAQYATVGVDYGVPPNRVKRYLVAAALHSDGVLLNPEPRARLTQFGDSSITFEVKYWIEDHAAHRDIRDRVMTAFWYRLNRERVRIPYPIRTVQWTRRRDEETADQGVEHRLALDALSRVPLFQCLPQDQMEILASRSKTLQYGAGEIVVQRGDSGQSLFVVESGTAEIDIFVDGRAHTLEAPIVAGDHFGEMSLLTGEPRSATIRAQSDLQVLRIDKEDLAPILASVPQLVEEMSKVLTQRREHTEGFRPATGDAAADSEADGVFHERIIGSVRRFFGLR